MPYFLILIGPMFKFKCQSSTNIQEQRGFKTKKKNIRKHTTNLRGLCFIHDNACAHKCKLVQDFLDTESVVHVGLQLHDPSYSPDLSPWDFFLLTLLK